MTIDNNGTIYISDTFANKIYEFNESWSSTEKPRVFVVGVKTDGPNGLYVKGTELFVASWGIAEPDFSTKVPGTLFKFDITSHEKKLIVQKPFGNLDGLEMDSKGNFIISDWKLGIIYRVSPSGKVKKIMEGIKNSADIGLDVKTNTLYIPSMSENKIIVKKL